MIKALFEKLKSLFASKEVVSAPAVKTKRAYNRKNTAKTSTKVVTKKTTNRKKK